MHGASVRNVWFSAVALTAFLAWSVLAVYGAATRVPAPLVRFAPGKESGNVVYSEAYEGGASFELELSGLRPGAPYGFTLNGKPQSPGNDELMRLGKTTMSAGVREGHLDFQVVRATADGTFRARTTTVPLLPGTYDLKFFVKDIERGWQVVLGLDVLQFIVQSAPLKGQPQIRITRLLPNVSIEGQVKGLSGDPTKFKVVVYVKTDKWYIHPFTSGGDGLSFASLKPDGSWKIKTVKRDFPADQVVVLLVDMSFRPPATMGDIDRIPALAKYAEEGHGRL